MTQITDFINFCKSKTLNKEIGNQLDLFYQWFKQEQNLNEEYIYPIPTIKEVETGDNDVEVVVVSNV